jgi:hypothetical protein
MGTKTKNNGSRASRLGSQASRGGHVDSIVIEKLRLHFLTLLKYTLESIRRHLGTRNADVPS